MDKDKQEGKKPDHHHKHREHANDREAPAKHAEHKGKHHEKHSLEKEELLPISYAVDKFENETQAVEAKANEQQQKRKPKEKVESQQKNELKNNAKSQRDEQDGVKKFDRDGKFLPTNEDIKVPRLKRLLDILHKFKETPEHKEILPVLKKFGLPSQNKLFDCTMKDDAKSFDFGNFIKLMMSPVLQGYAPVNTTNSYMPIPRDSDPVTAIRYRGVKMKPDEFLHTEKLKATKKRQELDQVKVVADDTTHFEFLKELAIQQMASLPLTVMFDILNEQIKVVEKICDGYLKHLGRSNQNTKVAQAHLELMKKHLEGLAFLGLESLPPLSVLRKFERPPEQENPFITSSSSSTEMDQEIDQLLHPQDVPHAIEEEDEMYKIDEENRMLQTEDNDEDKKNKKDSANQWQNDKFRNAKSNSPTPK